MISAKQRKCVFHHDNFVYLDRMTNNNLIAVSNICQPITLNYFFMYPINSVKVLCGKHVENLLNSLCNELTFRANDY